MSYLSTSTIEQAERLIDSVDIEKLKEFIDTYPKFYNREMINLRENLKQNLCCDYIHISYFIMSLRQFFKKGIKIEFSLNSFYYDNEEDAKRERDEFTKDFHSEWEEDGLNYEEI